MFSYMRKLLMKWPVSREYLKSRLDAKYVSETSQPANPRYILGLLDFVDREVILNRYKPLSHGNRRLLTYCKNVNEFREYCVTTMTAVNDGLDIKTPKRLIKSIAIDDWLLDDDDIPLTLNELMDTVIPDVKRLCHSLIKQEQHQSAGYFLRRSSKVLHDAKGLIELLIDFTN